MATFSGVKVNPAGLDPDATVDEIKETIEDEGYGNEVIKFLIEHETSKDNARQSLVEHCRELLGSESS